MLKNIRLINYLTIKNLEIKFTDKLNILTGETGAGKSLILSSIELFISKRFPKELTDESKTIIQQDSISQTDIVSEGVADLNRKDSLDDKIHTQDIKMDQRKIAKLKGFEGDPCNECGSFTLVRNGTCLKCNNCGSTTGCS